VYSRLREIVKLTYDGAIQTLNVRKTPYETVESVTDRGHPTYQIM
jgi:hypothetical protein